MSLYSETMRERLLLGIPAKGRIGEASRAFLQDAGAMVLGKPGRGYFGLLQGQYEIAVAFLPASEIVVALERGDLHLGISGKDLIHENIEAPEESLVLMEDLDFSHADLCVAVPKSWIDASDMGDLNDITCTFYAKHQRLMRVATKYPRLTRQIFSKHGVDMYRIVESLGATEGAPRAGIAEIVVDISSTGATLESNGLKPLNDIRWHSQAQLAVSLNAPWNDITAGIARRPLSLIAEHLSLDGTLWWNTLRQNIKNKLKNTKKQR